jgi:hypothetical protein
MAAKPRALAQAMSLANKETTYGVCSAAYLAAMTKRLAPTDADFAELEYEFIDDSDEINGASGPTLHLLQDKKGSLNRKYYASTEALGFYLAMLLGNVTSVTGPSSDVDEVQTITETGTVTAGTYQLKFRGATTPALNWDASAATMTSALEALSSVGASGFTVTGTGPWVITAGGDLADQDIPMIEIVNANFTGGTRAIAQTTEGSAVNAYTHTFKWPSECILNPPSFSFVEGLFCSGNTDTYKLYKGACVESIGLEMNGKGFMNMTCGIKFDGTETDVASFSFPAVTPVTRLTGGMVTVYFGSTLSTPIPTASLRNLKINMSAGLVIPPIISANTYVEEMQYGEKKPDLTVEFSIKGDKGDDIWEMMQLAEFGDTQKFKVVIQPFGVANREIQLIMNSVTPTVKPSKDGNETRLDVSLMPNWNSTDGESASILGPAQWIVESDIANYLVAI